MPVVVVDYGVGNIGSLLNMLEYIGIESRVAADPAGILDAERLILPGVGAFDIAIRNLNERGLASPLNIAVLERRRPVLGICLGMQLLANRSDEGESEGLGWIPGAAVRINPRGTALKVPHIGWSDIRPTSPSPLFPRTNDNERFYFVHSYHLRCDDPAHVAATVSYGDDLCVAVSRDNIHGVQFHPEKSHRFGMRLLKSFVEM